MFWRMPARSVRRVLSALIATAPGRGANRNRRPKSMRKRNLRQKDSQFQRCSSLQFQKCLPAQSVRDQNSSLLLGSGDLIATH